MANRDKEYRVMWEIDVCAGTPKKAAEQALRIQRDPESTATVFIVKDFNSGKPGKEIDLLKKGQTHG